jgi:hypothetical protein
MKKTQQLFANYNTRLKKRLLPDPTNREVLQCITKKYGLCLN